MSVQTRPTSPATPTAPTSSSTSASLHLPTTRRSSVLLALVVIGAAFVAVLVGALLSSHLTSAPAAPARPTTYTEENPNQREGRVPVGITQGSGETPNQREGRVAIPAPVAENPNQREGRVPGAN